MIRIHDLVTGFRGLSVPGVAYYADRALILPGTAVVADGPIDDHLGYLAEVGVGAKDVVRVAGDELVTGLARDRAAREAVAARLAAGAQVQFFNVTREEEELFDSFGVGRERLFSAPAAITREANDKAELRRLGARLGLADAFPEHAICDPGDRPAVYGAVGRLLGSPCDFIVLKRPDLASGDGMMFVERCVDWMSIVDPYLRQHARAKEIVVEAGWRHVPMSVQWELHASGPEFACATAQLIENGVVHQGNVLSSGELPDVTADDVAEMRRISEPFARHHWTNGFRGICGFDFLRATRTGRQYLLECNGRVTATTYANGLARQLAPRLASWAIVMSVVPTSVGVRTFGDVVKRLGRRMFSGTKGALPFNVRCLRLPEPKLALCCVGETALDATIVLDRAKTLLA
jgi:hypothetical protein